METTNQKAQEIKEYLNNKVFTPALDYGKVHKNLKVIQGVNLTKMRINRLVKPEQVMQYFWSAIIGTEKSMSFYHILKNVGVTTFEDIQVEFRERFNDAWLNS